MASLEWIKLTCDLDAKWQTLAIRRVLKLRTIDEVVGKLFRVWRHFENQSRDGHIPRIDTSDLDALVGKKGFAAAMASVGWLTIEADGLRLPRFGEYMGGAAREREAAAERMRRLRNSSATTAEPAQNDAATGAEHNPNADATGTERGPNTTVTGAEHDRNETVTVTPPKKEKEREKEDSLCGGSPPPEASQEKPPAKKAAKDRPRNPLFDAIAEVTGLDPATAGSLLGDVTAALAKASPPYTPADVRSFAARFHELCPHAAKDTPPRLRPTPKEVQRYIGLIRSQPPPAPASSRPATAAYD